MSENINDKLWDAAWRGEGALVSQYIEQGAEVDWKGGVFNNTALHQAARSGHTHVVTRLLDAGWSVEAKNIGGVTPLRLAAEHGHLETAKCLLLRGARIETQCNDKWTPLHEASRYGHASLVKLLLQCGASQEMKKEGIGKQRIIMPKNAKTRAVLKDFNKGGLKTKEELFSCEK